MKQNKVFITKEQFDAIESFGLAMKKMIDHGIRICVDPSEVETGRFRLEYYDADSEEHIGEITYLDLNCILHGMIGDVFIENVTVNAVEDDIME